MDALESLLYVERAIDFDESGEAVESLQFRFHSIKERSSKDIHALDIAEFEVLLIWKGWRTSSRMSLAAVLLEAQG
jgi:hypothetical protein